ncbi:prostaglandin E2 receptor EP4 subtype-like [Ostrea edulis]|uniref:prostaglandin E2 receptor EP4 subtype-like n=1 Tax=Ostrea edulis TaxID=37623 RepID=UPI002095C61C|nr:prostaglandin E2 receptor EP4 subtype-like [Ostrea edulis]
MESNLTTPPPEWPSPAPASLLLVLGVVGNTLALTILCCSAKTHKWRPFYRFVCGLAITDGGGVFLSYPLAMVRYASNFQYDYPQAMCDYMAFILMFTILGSALIVCAMSLDRFLAILYPHVYNTPTKNRRAIIMILGIWIFSAFISSLHLMAGRRSLSFFPGSWCFLDFVQDTVVDRVLAFLYSLIGILILTTAATLNMTVIVNVCRNIRQKRKKTKKKDVYIIGFLMLIVILFSTCITPLLINIFGHAVGTISGNGQFELFALRISVTNSIVDPWIYIVFRKSTVEFFQHKALKCGIVPRSLSSTEAQSPTKESSGTQESSHETSAI